MASIEFIQKRIEGKEKEIAKLTKKIERIEKAKASNWEKNPYYYSEDDLRHANRDLESANKALEEYKASLILENEKANSRNVPAIVEFLTDWKNRMHDFYMKAIVEYYEEYEKVRAIGKELQKLEWYSEEYKKVDAEYKKAHSELMKNLKGEFEVRMVETLNFKREVVLEKKKVKVKDGKYEYASHYFSGSVEESEAKLNKELQQEYNRKYDFIIERVTEITGEIKDASYLKVGAKGDLNGYIIGERGKAKVDTIGAGGYNIQCFHFRTLINEMK